MWASVGAIVASVVSLPTVSGILYFLGTAYFAGFAAGLGVPEDLFSYEYRDVLVASWQSVTESYVTLLRFTLIALLGVFIIWVLPAALASLATRKLKGRRDATAAQPEAAGPPRGPGTVDSRTSAKSAAGRTAAHAGLIVVILGGATYPFVLLLLSAVIRSQSLGAEGGRARRVECLRARMITPADTTPDAGAVAPELARVWAAERAGGRQAGASDRRIVIRKDSAPLSARPARTPARPLLYCARLGDRLLFLADSGFVVRDRADVKAFWVRDSLLTIRDSVKKARAKATRQGDPPTRGEGR